MKTKEIREGDKVSFRVVPDGTVFRMEGKFYRVDGDKVSVLEMNGDKLQHARSDCGRELITYVNPYYVVEIISLPDEATAA